MIYKIPYRSFSGDKILAFFLAFSMHSPALGGTFFGRLWHDIGPPFGPLEPAIGLFDSRTPDTHAL